MGDSGDGGKRLNGEGEEKDGEGKGWKIEGGIHMHTVNKLYRL